MLCLLMQNQLLSIDAELEEDRFKGLEMTELNDTEKCTSQVLRNSSKLDWNSRCPARQPEGTKSVKYICEPFSSSG